MSYGRWGLDKDPFSHRSFDTTSIFCTPFRHVLRAKWGAMPQAVYIGMGLIGLLVFAGASGPHILFSPTFGYLVGFILASYVTGKVSSGEAKFFRFLGSSLLGLLAIYLCGIIGLYLNLNFVMGKEVSFIGTIKIGVLPFWLQTH